MRASEILRGLLDLIDQIENPVAELEVPPEEIEVIDDPNRMKQIGDLMPTDCDDRTKQAYAGINAVTIDAGGGVNGPKHPSDIRGDHISLYPAYQDKGY
jgi:hypothetical protein